MSQLVSISEGSEVFLEKKKRLEREADHSSVSSTEVKN